MWQRCAVFHAVVVISPHSIARSRSLSLVGVLGGPSLSLALWRTLRQTPKKKNTYIECVWVRRVETKLNKVSNACDIFYVAINFEQKYHNKQQEQQQQVVNLNHATWNWKWLIKDRAEVNRTEPTRLNLTRLDSTRLDSNLVLTFTNHPAPSFSC